MQRFARLALQFRGGFSLIAGSFLVVLSTPLALSYPSGTGRNVLVLSAIAGVLYMASGLLILLRNGITHFRIDWIPRIMAWAASALLIYLIAPERIVLNPWIAVVLLPILLLDPEILERAFKEPANDSSASDC
jgi:hypothetical protein